ncbi:hypothetical protein RM553_12755 [Zunongwangia sp. F363]|uniref:Uncharacterized protein n=1 Tax=Autumnicola tepida TaxID=3075595 RepID=A0ABU3CCE8_9FLAO|nr:hypothetical protein [Zunongwangia sp. F363]MDT0643705.1 hypothetical protein [Zunongwangia sp. F363]
MSKTKKTKEPIVLNLADEGWYQEDKERGYYAISSLKSEYLPAKDRKQGYEIYKGKKLLATKKYLKDAKAVITKRSGRKVTIKY